MPIGQSGVTRNLPRNGLDPTQWAAYERAHPFQGGPAYATGYGGVDPLGVTDSGVAGSGGPSFRTGGPLFSGMPSLSGVPTGFGPLSKPYGPTVRPFGPTVRPFGPTLGTHGPTVSAYGPSAGPGGAQGAFFADALRRASGGLR